MNCSGGPLASAMSPGLCSAPKRVRSGHDAALLTTRVSRRRWARPNGLTKVSQYSWVLPRGLSGAGFTVTFRSSSPTCLSERRTL